MKPEVMRCLLPEVLLPAGMTTIISEKVSPGRVFYPTGFLLDPKVADQLLIQDVKVGRNSQLMGIGAIPGSLFSSVRPQVDVRLDAIASGLTISLTVVNTGPEMFFRDCYLVGSLQKPVRVLPMVLGFGHTEVATAASIIVHCQCDFEPQRLFVPPSVLRDFEIEHLRGEKYLGADDVSKVPLRMLTTTNILNKGGVICFEPISRVGAGTSLTMGVLNRAASPRHFSAAVLGITVG